eukprot:3371271-Pleurochrysis_carterae.AAC.1
MLSGSSYFTDRHVAPLEHVDVVLVLAPRGVDRWRAQPSLRDLNVPRAHAARQRCGKVLA